MTAFSFWSALYYYIGELFIAEKAHPDIKLFVLVTTMHNFAQGIQDMGPAVIADIHGNTQDVPDIARIAGKKTNPLHGKIHTHQRDLVPSLRGNTDRSFEWNTSTCSSIVHHTFIAPQ